MNNNYTTFINVSLSLPSLSHTPEHVSGAERWEFPLPLTWVFAPPLHPLKVGPDRSAQFQPPRSSTISSPLQRNRSHARSNLKLLCMPKTCRFQPKPYASDTLVCVADVERVCCVTAAEKIRFTSILSLQLRRGWTHTWYARIPQAMWLL